MSKHAEPTGGFAADPGALLRWQVLGVCPLLAVTPTLVQGGAIALTFTGVLLVTILLVSLLRDWLAPPLDVLFHVLVAAVAAAAAGYLLGSVAPALREVLHWYVPLLAMNTLILREASRGCGRMAVGRALLAASRCACGVAACVLLVAIGRELLATGGLCADWDLLGIACARRLLPWLPALHVFSEPAGALLGLGLLAALLAAWRAPRRGE
ncbi:MAG: hypothetical protein IT494_06425 [Gammaproteobacteria bacterium]|nr:hypothetical protein [Gammaproteobacteria bacterium]